MNQILKLTALVLGTCTTFHIANAQDSQDFDISANTAIVSDYIFRGISQSDENIAIQGGFDIQHKTGLHTGIWASSVDFNDNDEANIEVDLKAGYTGNINSTTYDVGALYYAYPGANNSLNYDFWEVYGSLGYDFDIASASISVNYSPDYFGDSGDAFYYAATIDAPLQENFTLSSHLGYQTIDDEAAFFGTSSPESSYLDWSIGLGYDWDNINFSVKYHDTNLDEPSECADGCDARIVFGISAAF